MKRNKKEIYTDISIATLTFALLSFLFVTNDIAERWYLFTRAHEEYELDEITAIFIAALIGGTILALRHVFVLKKLFIELETTQKELKKREREKLQSQKTAALGTLAGGLAHEINNALQPVLGLGEFIRKGLKESGNHKHEHYMDTIIKSSEHAQHIIENVLLFAHEKGLNFEMVDGKKTIRDIIGFCTNILESTTIYTIKTPPEEKQDEEPLYIKCNATGLYQIFYNLLKNATTAMGKKGEVIIDIQTNEMPDASGRPAIMVKISDSGYGMDEETLQKIFDPFFSTKELRKGTGLGLSTVYALVKEHNGMITVDSTLGKGTNFFVYFPTFQNIINNKEE